MKQLRFIWALIAIMLLFSMHSKAQYIMQDAMVTDCEGTLTDSDEGPNPGQYNHEEDYLFTICVEGASEITVIFDFFATEEGYDFFTAYDGPDTNSPIISVLDGVLSNPPVLVANSGCISFHFVSDDNIVAQGWSLEWFVEVEEIEDPIMTIESEIECPLGDLEFSVDPRVPCDVLIAENFQIIGSEVAEITDVIALDCDGDNTASSFALILADSLRTEETYLSVFNAYIINSCGDTLEFESTLSFELSDCPFLVEIYEISSSCTGDCGEIGVNILSSDPGPYNIVWSHTSDNSAEVDICTDTSTIIQVSVTNTSNGVSAQDQYNYMPLPFPQILNPLMSDTLCSRGRHTYEVDITGGRWNSRIMDDTDDKRYNFWRWRNSDGLQEDIITYTDPNGCMTSDTVYIYPINAGGDQAACLSLGTLNLTGENPDDGIWSGPFTSPDGVFTVSAVGEFDITYTSPDGCSDEKVVTIVDAIDITPVDTLCSNRRIDLRDYVNAYGGQWTGPGIGNAVLGRLRPWEANINEWNRYYYDISGCRDSIDIYINEIWAGPDRSVCTTVNEIQLPFHGNWTGPGLYNPLDSTYLITGLAPGTYNITGSRSGCDDTMKLTIEDVGLDYVGEPSYCYDADLIAVGDIAAPSPGGGVYSGPAVVNLSGEMYLDPAMVQGTETYIIFEALGCIDSVLVNIEQAVDLNDYEFCEFDDLQMLDNNGHSGYWEGPGILVPETGLINIEDLAIGPNEIYFVTDLGCSTPVIADVVAFVEAEINDVQEIYCYQDSNYILDLEPTNGHFTINGMQTSGILNPAELGSGIHELRYVVGTGACEDRTTTYVDVSEPISGVTYALSDTLCPGESTTIFVESSGGFDAISGFWDQGLGFGKSHVVFPESTIQYAVTLTDGCSDDLELVHEILVSDTFSVDVNYGPAECFGDSSFVELMLDPSYSYTVEWNGDPYIDAFRYDALPGQYQVNILNNNTGCEQDYWLVVPGSEPIIADFLITPNQECIDLLNNEISIINLASGYSSGYMNFGQGAPDVDLDLGNLSAIYNEIGEFTISQVVTNELGCMDSLSQTICVKNVVRVYMPNIFSPDGDGVNDRFEVGAIGIDNYEISIYNRWGNLVFRSNDIDDSWDGKFQGEYVMAGVYTVLISFEDQETGELERKAMGLTVVR